MEAKYSRCDHIEPHAFHIIATLLFLSEAHKFSLDDVCTSLQLYRPSRLPCCRNAFVSVRGL